MSSRLSRSLRAAFLASALAWCAPANADFTFTQGSGQTGFSFTAATGGTALCAATVTHCFASVPIDTAGAQLFASGNAGYVRFPSAQAVTGPLTDTQLRATAVPVTANAGTNLNTSALALDATLTTLSGKLPTSLTTAGADGVSNTLSGLQGYSRLQMFNGTTWDRVPGDTTNGLWVNVKNTNANLATNADAIAAVAAGAAGAGSPVNSSNYVYNGTTWDRMPGTTAGVTVRSPTAANFLATATLSAGAALVGDVNVRQGGTALSATNGGFQNILQGNAVLSATNGLFANQLQGNAVLSATNGTFTNLLQGNAALSATNPLPTLHVGTAYETVAASQTAQSMGATGATGDYLSHCVVTPGTTSPGVVTILDNATAVVSFVGGASSVSNLVSFAIPIGAISVSGAWKITTGTNVTVVCVGRFT